MRSKSQSSLQQAIGHKETSTRYQNWMSIHESHWKLGDAQGTHWPRPRNAKWTYANLVTRQNPMRQNTQSRKNLTKNKPALRRPGDNSHRRIITPLPITMHAKPFYAIPASSAQPHLVGEPWRKNYERNRIQEQKIRECWRGKGTTRACTRKERNGIYANADAIPRQRREMLIHLEVQEVMNTLIEKRK